MRSRLDRDVGRVRLPALPGTDVPIMPPMPQASTTGIRMRLLGLGLLLAALAGCSGRYFHDAGPPPEPPPRYTLDSLPQREFWTGYLFNGVKTGFSHVVIAPLADEPGRYVVRGEAALTLRFLGLQKKFLFVTEDVVNADLTLVRFRHRHDMDGNRLELDGAVRDTGLDVRIASGGRIERQQLPLAAPVYPMSAVALYPALHGLETGRRYDYPVYDSQSQRLAPVRQEIGAFERSTLFQGQAFRVETRLHGHRTRTWIDTRGRALFEMALNGVLLSRLETEREAKRYLALASLNKQDALLDFSRVALDRPLPGARELDYLEVALDGLDAAGLPPADARQRCVPHDAGAVCTLRRTASPADGADLAPWLATTLAVPTADPRIQALAREIAADAATPAERIRRLLAWLRANIRQEPVDAFSALDVLETRRAECQGHAYLYAALARALDIPTRVVNGLVYAPELQGFLYHSWTESLVDGRWHAVDPTFGQFDADATHIKLVEGETLGDLLPLVDVMGQVRARLLARAPGGGE